MKLTSQERLALAALGLLLGLGAVVRAAGGGAGAAEWVGDGPEPAGAAALLAAVEDSAQREAARSRPLGPRERLDPNRASVDDLARLPGVGPALAERIVARRQREGKRYRTLADLDSVPGVGPALLARIAPHVALPAATPPPAVSRPARTTGAAAASPVDLNRAGAAELEALSGVGPALAARIVEWRARHGPFRSVEDLERVPGIGPAKLARLRPLVRATP